MKNILDSLVRRSLYSFHSHHILFSFQVPHNSLMLLLWHSINGNSMKNCPMDQKVRELNLSDRQVVKHKYE